MAPWVQGLPISLRLVPCASNLAHLGPSSCIQTKRRRPMLASCWSCFGLRQPLHHFLASVPAGGPLSSLSARPNSDLFNGPCLKHYAMTMRAPAQDTHLPTYYIPKPPRSHVSLLPFDSSIRMIPALPVQKLSLPYLGRSHAYRRTLASHQPPHPPFFLPSNTHPSLTIHISCADTSPLRLVTSPPTSLPTSPFRAPRCKSSAATTVFVVSLPSGLC